MSDYEEDVQIDPVEARYQQRENILALIPAALHRSKLARAVYQTQAENFKLHTLDRKTELANWQKACRDYHEAENYVRQLCQEMLVNILDDQFDPRVTLYPGMRKNDTSTISPESKEGH